MNVLRAYIRLPPFMGGMENHIEQITIFQRLIGWNVDLCAMSSSSRSIRHKRFDLRWLRLVKSGSFRNFLFCCYIALRFWRSRSLYDVIHFHGDFRILHIFVCMIIFGYRSQKLILSVHDNLKIGFYYHCLLYVCNYFGVKIHTTSFSLFNDLKKTYSEKYLLFKQSGVKENFFKTAAQFCKLNDGRKMALTVAQLVNKKNLSFILDISVFFEDVDFIIAGVGPEKQRLSDEIRRRNISNVFLVGQCDVDSLRVYYGIANVFILPSFVEGTPTVLLEAECCGLPWVASKASDIHGWFPVTPIGVCVELQVDDFISAIKRSLFNHNYTKFNFARRSNSFLSWNVVAADISRWIEA